MFVFFWFGIFWFHFRFYVTQITCFGLSVFSWNTWPRGTPGAQAGVAQSQGQCPADHGCEYVRLPGLRHAWRCLRLTHVLCGQFILVCGCCFICLLTSALHSLWTSGLCPRRGCCVLYYCGHSLWVFGGRVLGICAAVGMG